MSVVCPSAAHWIACKCKPPAAGRVVGPASWGWDEYTYYPWLGMMAVGRRLFPEMSWVAGQGVHYWEAMTIGRWDDYGVMNRELRLANGCYSISVSYAWPGSTRVGECMSGGWRGHWKCRRFREWVLIVPQLWRVQRAVRAFLARRRWMREARVVYVLGMLGPQSGHACTLQPEMVARVCAYVL
jgi:hypothetical protein